VLGVFITKVCHTCYYQINLYSETKVPVPNIIACTLIFVWISGCASIAICDGFLIKTNNTLFREIVYYVYMGTLISLFMLMQWIGSDLNYSFHIYLPSMFEQYKLSKWGKIKIIVLGAYVDNICQFYMDKNNIKKN